VQNFIKLNTAVHELIMLPERNNKHLYKLTVNAENNTVVGNRHAD